MALFRDLPPDERSTVIGEMARQETAIRDILANVNERATMFLLVALVGGATAAFVLATEHVGKLRDAIIALSLFLLGLVLLGLLHATNHESLYRLTFRWSAFKSGVFRNQIDTESLNAYGKPTLIQKIPSLFGYAASVSWVAGIVFVVIAVSSAGTFATPRLSQPSAPLHEEPSGVAQQAPSADAPRVASAVGADLTRNATSKAIALADKIGIVAVIVGALQVLALFFTYAVMRGSARRQSRAYVGVETFDLIDGALSSPPQPWHAGFPGARLTIKNSGTTPAYNVRTHAFLDVIDPINESKLAMPPIGEFYGTTLWPNTALNNTPWFTRGLTQPEILDVNAGAKAIFLFGRVEYVDAFKKKHFTMFRLRYTGPFPPQQPMGFTFSAQGNTAD